MKRFAFRPARAAAVVLVGAALPFAAVATANASTTNWGCTVSPLRPVYDHTNSAGVKVIRYNMTVNCSAGRTIDIEQHVHEYDNWGSDDHVTTSDRNRHFSTTDTVTMWLDYPLPDTEIGDESMYQHVSFRVTPDDLSQSGWTAWEDSPIQVFSK